jgi:hypothetical protein
LKKEKGRNEESKPERTVERRKKDGDRKQQVGAGNFAREGGDHWGKGRKRHCRDQQARESSTG